MIRLFVGLGNPGPEYEDTRHNAGFWWVDQLSRQWRASPSPDKAYHGLVARVNHPQGPAWLLQPMTYMNLSGKSVGALARFFKIAPEEILVVHDELDLQPGEVKIKKGGGARATTASRTSPRSWARPTTGAFAWASATPACAARWRPSCCASRPSVNAS